MTTLSDKQQRFVEEYLIDSNATQSAIRAGYSKKGAEVQGHRLLSNVNVRAAIDAGRAQISKRVEVTQDYVVGTILDTVQRCQQATEVRDRKGDIVLVETPTGELAPAYTFDAKNVLRGAELLGKHLGMFKDRVELTGKDGGPIQTEELSDTEKARRIAFALTKGSKASN